ncbi:arginyl-transferase family protein [Kiloniella sp. b19]|uniref:aspartate/glutamate leucyltransferase n=1 Tax=Kiloniella sp. GXU_MW_B19 TaxID=3141326 RepID=UPI0031DDD2C3
MQVFNTTPPAPCAYDPSVQEQKILCKLYPDNGTEQYDVLIHSGFRRQHDYVYKSLYEDPGYCLSLRIPVEQLKLSKTQRRIKNKNRDLETRFRWVGKRDFFLDESDYALFRRYVSGRHLDGGMADMGRTEFESMILESPIKTALLDFILPDGGKVEQGSEQTETRKLLGSCLIDQVFDGYSAVYSYFDPDETRRSLGGYMILRLAEEARKRDLPYVYLGYWIPSSPKMTYKANFQPAEVFLKGQWSPLQSEK